MGSGPAVRRRKLGEELRNLRCQAGLTSDQAAHLVGWHQSKVSRIETGRSGAKPADVALLLDVYGVRNAQQRALLAALSDPGGRLGADWWHAYRGVLPPQYRDFISLEAQARSARTLETSAVPGLLQTADYARAVTRAALPELPQDTLGSLVEVRLARQKVLRAETPLELSAVIDEAVLRRPVGGPEVMADQLRHLTDIAQLPHVQLQVLPFDAGAYIGMTCPFIIFSFPNIADLDVVVLDHLTSSLHLERREELEAYGAAFRTVQQLALPPQHTLELIAGIGDGV
jgi:transcriptional regulator with XRE-family HTH domain